MVTFQHIGAAADRFAEVFGDLSKTNIKIDKSKLPMLDKKLSKDDLKISKIDVDALKKAAKITEKAKVPTTKVPVSTLIPEATVKTNINTATYAELTKIAGITDAVATKIIEYRAKNGAFKSVEDLKLVDGITEEVFAKIKTAVTI